MGSNVIKSEKQFKQLFKEPFISMKLFNLNLRGEILISHNVSQNYILDWWN